MKKKYVNVYYVEDQFLAMGKIYDTKEECEKHQHKGDSEVQVKIQELRF